MGHWVLVPEETPRWFNLDQARDLKIYFSGDFHGPKIHLVTAEYPPNRSVTLYRANSQQEALDWIDKLLGKEQPDVSA